ncbi:MAG: DUF4258 domain-containing protein [Chloroflexi bacterium]|nr:DUF4258 domain-containing protein [Chloroflexota bacterium]
MLERGISSEDVEAALNAPMAEVIRNYPQVGLPSAHCLIWGRDNESNSLHVLVTYPHAEVITVYKPLPPRWKTPQERG